MVRKTFQIPFLALVILALFGNSLVAEQTDDKFESTCKEIATDEIAKLMGENMLSHDGKRYGWLISEGSFSQIFVEMLSEKDEYSASVHIVNLEDENFETRTMLAVGHELGRIDLKNDFRLAIVSVRTEQTTRFKKASEFYKPTTKQNEMPLHGLVPWSKPKTSTNEYNVLIRQQESSSAPRVVSADVGLKKPTLMEVVNFAGLDQSVTIEDKSLKLIYSEGQRRFSEIFHPKGDRYFLSFAVTEIELNLKDDSKPGPATTHLATLTELAGTHQIWMSEIELSETQKLNGMKRLVAFSVGLRGISRHALFRGRRWTSDPISDNHRMRYTQRKYQFHSWSDWAERQTFLGKWYYVEYKDQQRWCSKAPTIELLRAKPEPMGALSNFLMKVWALENGRIMPEHQKTVFFPLFASEVDPSDRTVADMRAILSFTSAELLDEFLKESDYVLQEVAAEVSGKHP